MATDIMLSVKTHDPFLDIGAGNIRLAMDYPRLFTDFHLNNSFKKYIKHDDAHFSKLINKMSSSAKLKGLNQIQMADILSIMAFVTYGIIFNMLQGKLDQDYDEIISYIEDIADDVIAGYKIRKVSKQ